MKKNNILFALVLTAAFIFATGNSVLSKSPDSNPRVSEEFLAKVKTINDRSNVAAAKHLEIPVASILTLGPYTLACPRVILLLLRFRHWNYE